MPDPSKHTDQRNLIESILRYIPGFSGYLEKEYRRESDQLARNWMADCLQRGKSGLDSYILQLTDAGQIDVLPGIERLKAKLDKQITKFRGDVQGYSGFFDYVRIREDELDDVYERDHSLMADVDQLGKALGKAGTSSTDANQVLAELNQLLADIERNYNERAEVLQGLSDD